MNSASIQIVEYIKKEKTEEYHFNLITDVAKEIVRKGKGLILRVNYSLKEMVSDILQEL